jgi:tRNA pseudouridine55 synthase
MRAALESGGIVLLDKPLGLSSHSATQRVKRLFGAARAGHVGSLDPLATGMLPICLGEATKVAGQIVEGAKHYAFTIALGARTATGDVEGEVVETAEVPALTQADVDAVLAGLVGRGLQTPPMYSAVKVGGQPLYRLARQGREVPRAPRPVEIHALHGRLVAADRLECAVRCAKGLYVRVLAEDIARALGSCGHVVALRRLQVEPFDPADMRTLEAWAELLASGAPVPLLPADAPLVHLPAVQLDDPEARRMLQGQAVRRTVAAAETLRLYGPGGEFLGLGSSLGDGLVRARRLFATTDAGAAAAAAGSAPGRDGA